MTYYVENYVIASIAKQSQKNKDNTTPIYQSALFFASNNKRIANPLYFHKFSTEI